MTNYNGKTLLDGTYSGSKTTTVEEELDAILIEIGDYTISEDGYYKLAEGYTGNITISAKNVRLTQADPETALQNVSIIGNSGGNQNLWIEDLNIENTEDKNVIKFQGADNHLTVKGSNTFSIIKESLGTLLKAVINVSGRLSITGDGNLKAEQSQTIPSANYYILHKSKYAVASCAVYVSSG